MMGLGNGRRSMKSPPLLLAALVACVVVLGFNYWIASSRSADLQTRILELEVRVRRAAAERGAVELKKNEFQGELQKQREQLDKIQSSHSFQLESVNRLYQDEKAALVSNITTSERVIRDLQDQLKALQRSYGRLQQDLFQFQRNQSNLERKFSYDLNQCINQMREAKEQCEERVEELARKGDGAAASRSLSERDNQRQQAPNESQPRLQGAGLLLATAPPSNGSVARKGQSQRADSPAVVLDLKGQRKKEEPSEIQGVSEAAAQRDPGGPLREPGLPAGGRGLGGARENGHTVQVPAALLANPENQEQEEPERDQLVIREGPEEQVAAEGGRNQQKLGDDEDYNMDENEAESERDKQAALAGSDRNVNVFNAKKRNIINLLDQRDKRNHTL